jgi:hypothetical protein
MIVSSAEACSTVRGKPSSPDDADHHLVAHEFSAVHDRLGPPADVRAGVHGIAEDVPRRDLRDPARPCEPLGLRAFAGAGRTKHQQVQGHSVVSSDAELSAVLRLPTAYARRPRMRVFFMNPS